jgi:hypothetical protein
MIVNRKKRYTIRIEIDLPVYIGGKITSRKWTRTYVLR